MGSACGAKAQPVTPREDAKKKGSSSARGSVSGSDWKMWNALDMQDEEDRHKMAVLFRYLEDTSGREGSIGVVADTATGDDTALQNHDEDYGEMMAVVVQRDYEGLTLTDPLEPGIGRDLLQSFVIGLPLHKKFAAMVLNMALDVLNACPNVTRLKAPTPESTLTIVGDLHGEITDLNEIFRLNGSPSASSVYIFNGDFVDRGERGVEVLLVLLTMKVLHPEYIHLNRGNHEDNALCAGYGFKEETFNKYGAPMFREFVRVFKSIPLCAVVGGESPDGKGLFVVHGGIFEDRSVTIDRIDEIDRKKYASVIAPKPRRNASEHEKWLEDMTWSDPKEDNGMELSDRGSGILYGPDITREFLKKNKVHTLVRSHECIENGAERVNLGEGQYIFTVFSASNYSGGDNVAAILKYSNLTELPEVITFRTRDPPPRDKVQEGNSIKLQDLICRRHFRLLRGFEADDVGKTNTVSKVRWEAILSDVLRIIDVDWVKQIGSKNIPMNNEGEVLYREFLDKYTMMEHYQKDDGGGSKKPDANMLKSLYGNYEMLKTVFASWDLNHDGKVDVNEFTEAITKINKVHPDGPPLDPQEMFSMLDLDGSGVIDINELCESSRLVKVNRGLSGS